MYQEPSWWDIFWMMLMCAWEKRWIFALALAILIIGFAFSIGGCAPRGEYRWGWVEGYQDAREREGSRYGVSEETRALIWAAGRSAPDGTAFVR